MIVAQSALLCLEATFARLFRRASLLDAGHLVPALPDVAHATGHIANPGTLDPEPVIAALPVSASIGVEAIGGPLSTLERRARASALKGLALSRERQFDAARAAFAAAARLDPELDLTRTPNFWRLERAAHEAAIEAYLDAGREDDATLLRARVRSTFRPKPVRIPSNAALVP